MQVSVITTFLNTEKFIIDSFDSIMNQTFQDFQWVIVNDGSTDNSENLILKYLKRKNTIYLSNQSNMRIPYSRRLAMEYCNGDYIFIHDADDISLPTRFEKQLNFMADNKEYFAIGAHATAIDVNSQKVQDYTYTPLEFKEILNHIIFHRVNPIIDPSSCFRKDIYNKIGGYSMEDAIYLTPDLDLWYRAICNGYKIANMSDILIKYRINPNGMTQSRNPAMVVSHDIVYSRYIDTIREIRKQNLAL